MKNGWFVAGLIALLLAVYGSLVLHGNFVLWDDNNLITNNTHIQGLTFANIGYNFTHFDPELYIPLTFLTYQFDYAFGGLDASFFHFTNLLLHTLNALLVTLLLYQLTKKRWIAVLCGLLFAVHPLNVEAVAWASARKDLLSTFFFFLSCFTYLRYRSEQSASSYWWSVVFFFFGVGPAGRDTPGQASRSDRAS